jgi:pantoate--beta-alanine ligase
MEIIGMPTVREVDGLAMSSRNTYLQEKEREAALSLSQSLLLAKGLYDDGERDAARILPAVRDRLAKNPLIQLEYAKICSILTLRDLAQLGEEALLALAVKIGKTRLIDNHIFGEPLNIALF